jgi:hypothetical protein
MSRSYTSSPPSASMACSGTALPFLSRNLRGGNEENHETFSQGIRSQGQDLNPRLPEYEAGLLTSQQRHLTIHDSVRWRAWY